MVKVDMFVIYAIIVFFSIFNSTTNCDMVRCRNDEDCRVWGKLHVVCIGPSDVPMCFFMNSPEPGGKCGCITSSPAHNISG
ncbi:hypothetical protein P8452_50614 [Trifolium repens]|nr:hypothetical protein P8452_50614 [Trifolium repens]